MLIFGRERVEYLGGGGVNIRHSRLGTPSNAPTKRAVVGDR